MTDVSNDYIHCILQYESFDNLFYNDAITLEIFSAVRIETWILSDVTVSPQLLLCL